VSITALKCDSKQLLTFFEFSLERLVLSGKRPSVVLADDSKMIRRLNSRLFDKEGCDVICFSDGRLAYEYLRDESSHTDLAVFDINMAVGHPDGAEEGWDGDRAVREYRLHEAHESGSRKLPILISSSESGERILSAIQDGATGFVSKTLTPREVQSILYCYVKV